MQYCFHASCHVGGRSKKYYLCTVLTNISLHGYSNVMLPLARFLVYIVYALFSSTHKFIVLTKCFVEVVMLTTL